MEKAEEAGQRMEGSYLEELVKNSRKMLFLCQDTDGSGPCGRSGHHLLRDRGHAFGIGNCAEGK